jgi:hypothetical protein
MRWQSCQAQAARVQTPNFSSTAFVLPVTHHHFALYSHPGCHETELPAAVGGLVQVHEVHVNGVPGDVPVELGVQVHKGLGQLLNPPIHILAGLKVCIQVIRPAHLGSVLAS